jgi:formylglycine-generating enzyme required for sulfatase activity
MNDQPLQLAKLLVFGTGAIIVVIIFALKRHESPNRCAPDWAGLGPRCCAADQTLVNGSCYGRARTCPTGFHQVTRGDEGCAVDPKRIHIGPTHLSIGPNDWQSEQVTPTDANVPRFLVDATEVTVELWLACVTEHKCTPLAIAEPGQPVTRVTPEQAAQFCAAQGGRLPRLNERMALAAGAQSRRYPWGQTGLVCRRATFGTVAGPCAEGGNQPDVAGSHPDGQSPEGVLDLSGNVAEFAIDAAGRAWFCGGSFRSKTALELKSWACVLGSAPADDIGFRCVYDATE